MRSLSRILRLNLRNSASKTPNTTAMPMTIGTSDATLLVTTSTIGWKFTTGVVATYTPPITTVSPPRAPAVDYGLVAFINGIEGGK